MLDDIKPPAKKPADKPEPAPAPKIEATPKPVEDVETINEADLDQPQQPAPKNHWWTKLHAWWHGLSRKQKAAWGSGAVIVLALAVFGILLGLNKSPTSLTGGIIKPLAQSKSTTIASPLTGVQVAPALAKRPVTAIMIENSTDARPQSGLQDAGVVYEAIAEAGITRFMALYQDTSPQYIGPVRSLRPYYIDFAAPFQASIVHVGGSPDALSEVQNGSYRNLDQFYNGSYFTRISSRDAPHNVYTSFDQLDKLNQSKGYTTSQFISWPRKADKKLTKPTAKTIDLAISSDDYHVHYDYDPATNSYNRSEGGAAHMDLVSSSDTTGVQLKPKVVIALVMSLSNGQLDASGAYYSDYTDSGSGAAYIFQDGGVTVGTWTKQDTQSQFQFTDSGGHEVKLNAGQTWISLVSDSGQVSYFP